MRSWIGGLARRVAGVAGVVVMLLAGCGGGDGKDAVPTAACNDAAFRGQDEELYVARATVSNAVGGSGDAATLLLDLRRGRAALAGYLEAHPPCSDALKVIATHEGKAVAALDEAIAALAEGSAAAAPLAQALELLESAQGALASSR